MEVIVMIRAVKALIIFNACINALITHH